jgi:hypothetical protein
MSEHDPEFEEFLKRRRPLFRADEDDGLEPPPELDRIVLRQAREAIRPQRPVPMYRGPRWAAPLAIAATLVLGLAVVFQAGNEQRPQVVPEVTVENIAQQVEPAIVPAPPPPTPTPPPVAHGGDVVVDLTAPAGTEDATASDAPEWRRNSESWLAEIERLRSAGETARAELEMAEYNRQQRAFAGSPDR